MREQSDGLRWWRGVVREWCDDGWCDEVRVCGDGALGWQCEKGLRICIRVIE